MRLRPRRCPRRRLLPRPRRRPRPRAPRRGAGGAPSRCARAMVGDEAAAAPQAPRHHGVTLEIERRAGGRRPADRPRQGEGPGERQGGVDERRLARRRPDPRAAARAARPTTTASPASLTPTTGPEGVEPGASGVCGPPVAEAAAQRGEHRPVPWWSRRRAPRRRPSGRPRPRGCGWRASSGPTSPPCPCATPCRKRRPPGSSRGRSRGASPPRRPSR